MNVVVKNNKVLISGMPKKGEFEDKAKTASILKEIGNNYQKDPKLVLVKNGIELFADPEFVRATVEAYETKNFSIVRNLWKFADNIPALVKYPETHLLGTARQPKYEARDGVGGYFELAMYNLDHAD